ncbi:DJ-1/PfpI family protein [Microbacterium sp. NEAU-LLC]|uniref:DJ-1/PfpI family protein n=1 Tax=Microbacterium helvum TaxID=2773713 RepID=A0ABR8NUU5_9MICO|nr:DJ-1/PfpI family protein [Microbacterium helvum]MBD3943813.1 DJ-1/PfpI family protein [Microbacterium helvum]
MAAPVRFLALVFPNVTQLDLTGPAQFFSAPADATVDLAWKTRDPVVTDAGFAIVPTTDLADAPQADVLMIPGGQGVFDLLDDPETLDFVRRQAAGARFVTSVCTGAFLLGAAGLLVGKRATTHWNSHALLGLLGAIPEQARVVRDGNIITGGGVTAGLDFALTVLAEVFDEQTARAVQLGYEYDPAPPFDAGTPSRPEADQAQVQHTIATRAALREPVVRRAAAALAEVSA